MTPKLQTLEQEDDSHRVQVVFRNLRQGLSMDAEGFTETPKHGDWRE